VNPLAAALLVTPALLAAPYRGTVDLSDRTELRGGQFGLPTDPALNAETVPSIALSLETHTSGLTLSYAPRLALTDLQLGVYPSVLQNGFVDMSWHARNVRISLSEYASYGTLNYSTLQLPASAAPGAFRVDPLLRRIVSYEGTSTALTLLLTPERRWSLRFALSYSLSGAAHEADRDVLPLYYGPRFETAFEYALLRPTHSVTRASIEKATVSTGQEYVFVQGTEGVAQRFSKMTDAELSVGATEVRSDLPAPRSERRYDTYGTVEAVLNQRLPYRERFDLQFRAALSPAINRVTGLVTQQVQAIVRSNYRSYPWTAAFEGGFADSIHDEPGAIAVISGQLTVGYFFSKAVEVEAGTRTSWQKVGGVDTPTVQELFFGALTLRDPTLHF
jgi:hypothetical protein